MTTDATSAETLGDSEAFARLVDPYRRELHVHCYRILGSVADAEDALQEALLAAWQGLAGFEGRSSMRTWLSRVATSRCLDALRSRSRRPRQDMPSPGGRRTVDLAAVDPYPDALLEGVADDLPGPEARYEAKEATSLAFVAALHVLPPRQRAVVILRDALGFHSAEVARMLESTEESVSSALKRPRASLRQRYSAAGCSEPAPLPNSDVERELVERLTRAFESGDVAGIVALLTDDVKFVMPPDEYDGRIAAGEFLELLASTLWQHRGPRLIATRANGQPAFGLYIWDPASETMRAMGLLAITLAGHRVRTMTRFDESVLPHFGMPQHLVE